MGCDLTTICCFDPFIKNMSIQITPATFLCGAPYKIGDIITTEEMVYPPWWMFWQKPRKVTQKYEVVYVSNIRMGNRA